MNYTKQYIQIVTRSDVYFGYVEKDDDIDMIRLHPVDWDNNDMEEDQVQAWKHTLVTRPFIMDIKKDTIKTVTILPKVR